MFIDRTDAGRQVAKKLLGYKNENVVVLAIPKGGVPVGYEIARALNAELDLIISRKLPLPRNPEGGFGAVSETGNMTLNKKAISYYNISHKEIEKIKEEQLKEIRRRIERLRKGNPLKNIKDKIVILVDDGIAMGSTMEVSILAAREKGASEIIVAVPTASYSAIEKLKKIADKIICPDIREYFVAVADAYQRWHDLSDEEVIDIMKKYKKER